MAVKVRDTNQQEHTLLDIGEVAEELNNAKTQITTEITTQLKEEGIVPDLPDLPNALLGGDTDGNLQAYTICTQIDETSSSQIPNVSAVSVYVNQVIENTLSTGGTDFEDLIIEIVDEHCLSSADKSFYSGVKEIIQAETSANNILFTEDINITVPVGIITADMINTNNGLVVYEAKGKSIQEVLTGLFSETKDPEVDYPSVSITVSGGSGEVGNTFAYPTATLTITDVGSYTYGSKDANNTKYEAADTGVIFASGNVVLKNGDDNTTTNETAMTTGNTITLQATTGETTYSDTAIKYTFTGTASYTESDRIPINNLGTKIPSKQITSDSATVTSKTATFTGYRKCFWGYRKTVDALENPESITSEQVRNSTIIEKSSRYMIGTANNSGNYTVPAETKQVYFLAPNGQFTSLSITNKSALGAPVACTYKSGIQVEGANNYAAIAYDLWYVNLDSEFSDSAELVLTWK